jgi:hypothetical protein
MTIVISGEGKKMGEKVGQISVLFQYFIHFLNIWCEIKNQTKKAKVNHNEQLEYRINQMWKKAK